MEINKVQWRMIAKGEKLPCDSFLMKKDGTITSMVTGAGVVVGQDAYYLPVEELRSFPKEESEDERIRKELIAEVKEQIDCIPVPDCRDKEDEKALKQLNKRLAWLEKQGEQESEDKVEPKFKVGDWFVKNDGSHINVDYNICKISKVGNGYYTIESIYGYTGKITFDTFDENYHLWTIQDAKAGDVLADGDLPFIFKKVDLMMHSYAYCGITVDDCFKIESEGESGEWTWMQDIKPATKEQRDQLEKAMADAGYTFDFEKKELKKVEQKQEWSEEDEYHKRQILRILKDNGCSQTLQERTDKWIEERLKSLRPQSKIYYWTENEIKFAISDYIRGVESYEKMVEKLRCLKPQSQWKPSKEQIKALEAMLTVSPQSPAITSALLGLYNDLKKLREE